MTSFARTVSLLILAPALLVAGGISTQAGPGRSASDQDGSRQAEAGPPRPEPPASEQDGSWQPPPGLAERVTARIAERWGVSPGMVGLEWGRLSGLLDGGEGADLHILGKGSDGFFVVLLGALYRGDFVSK